MRSMRSHSPGTGAAGAAERRRITSQVMRPASKASNNISRRASATTAPVLVEFCCTGMMMGGELFCCVGAGATVALGWGVTVACGVAVAFGVTVGRGVTVG